MPFQCLLCIVCYDLWFYAVHRLLHVPILYNRFHYQHHAYRHPRAEHTFTASLVENTVSGLGILLPFLVISVNFAEFGFAWLFCFIRGVARHDLRAGFLSKHHLAHHLYPDCNYSAWYIDWLFGTLLSK